jgi:phosphoserine phosphatase RsbU/P
VRVLELVLVVSEPSSTADRLCDLLCNDGMPSRQATPTMVLTDWQLEDGIPDMLLVGATLGMDIVRRVTRRIMQMTIRPPTVVVFADDDVVDLTPHVTAGLDYVVPPFLPRQLVSRLLACHFRQAMCRTAEEIQTTADLLKYERELQIGREIQAGFLPEELPARAGWQLTARFRPAREVSGDFYDAFELLGGARIGVVIADVCDKGVGAALYMALIRSLLRHTAICMDTVLGAADKIEPGRDADAALLLRAVGATNDYLTTNHLRQGYFATLFFGIVDPSTGSMVYINCGHNPPVLRRSGGDYTLLGPTGPALSLVADSVFAIGRAQLEPGDLLFAYTDGVPEAKDSAGRFFTQEVMLSLVAGQAGAADELLDHVERRLRAHVGSAEQADDITMVALRRQPNRVTRRRRGSTAPSAAAKDASVSQTRSPSPGRRRAKGAPGTG